MITRQADETMKELRCQAEEQVLFLKSRDKMLAQEIIRMYGGQSSAHDTYSDAIERIAVFNLANAAKNGFVA